jgi:hypothetical protein
MMKFEESLHHVIETDVTVRGKVFDIDVELFVRGISRERICDDDVLHERYYLRRKIRAVFRYV